MRPGPGLEVECAATSAQFGTFDQAGVPAHEDTPPLAHASSTWSTSKATTPEMVSTMASEVRKITTTAGEDEVHRIGDRARSGGEDDPSDPTSSEVLFALRWSEVLESGMRPGAACTRRAIHPATFEGVGCRIEGDGEPAQSPAGQCAVGALLEVGQEPRVDARLLRQLLGAQAELGPAMGDATGQIATARALRPLGDHCPSGAADFWLLVAGVGRGCRCHETSLSLKGCRTIGTKVPRHGDLRLFQEEANS